MADTLPFQLLHPVGAFSESAEGKLGAENAQKTQVSSPGEKGRRGGCDHGFPFSDL